ncbi:hypothetical protein Tco_1484526 [Tanacetum coccineum]
MTITEYIKYEAEMEGKAWKNTGSYFPSNYDNKDVNFFDHIESRKLGYEYHLKVNTQYDLPLPPCFEPIQPYTQDRYEPLNDDTELVSEDETKISKQGMSDNIDNDKPLAPKPQHKELSPEEDLDEWLKTKMEKCMVRQDKEGEEDALIDVLKSLMKECKVVYKGTSSHETKDLLPRLKKKGTFRKPYGIGENRVLFDMDGKFCQSSIPIEKQRSRFCDDESIDTIDSNDEMQELEDGYKKVKNFENITSRWHVCKPARVFYDNECGKDCRMWPTCNPDLSFCSGYDAIYGKGKNGMLEQWMCFQDHETQSIRGNRMKFVEFLKVRCGSKSIDDMTRERRYYEWIAQNTEFEDDDIPKETIKYALDDVWEKCEKFHDTAYQWHNEGFEEEEQWESDIEKTKYEPPFVKSETFKVNRYTFKNGKRSLSKELEFKASPARCNVVNRGNEVAQLTICKNSILIQSGEQR